MDRLLTATERAALDTMLTVGFPGVDELRIQAATARVVGRCPVWVPHDRPRRRRRRTAGRGA